MSDKEKLKQQFTPTATRNIFLIRHGHYDKFPEEKLNPEGMVRDRHVKIIFSQNFRFLAGFW